MIQRWNGTAWVPYSPFPVWAWLLILASVAVLVFIGAFFGGAVFEAAYYEGKYHPQQTQTRLEQLQAESPQAATDAYNRGKHDQFKADCEQIRAYGIGLGRTMPTCPP